MRHLLLVPFCLGIVACGGNGDSSPAEEDIGDPSGSPTSPETLEPPEEESTASMGEPGAELNWESLVEGEWSVPPGKETYVCVRHTIEQDTFISAFEAINPPGTHHTLLTAGDPSGPDGVTPCTAADNNLLSLYGSGVGTNPMVFPEGVAVRLAAGTQLLLNLHLFNSRAETLTGTSGTRFVERAAEDVVHEAEGVLAGTVELDIPPQTETVHTGSCTMTHDLKLFAVAPHMHQLGTHSRVVAHTADRGDITLHDGPYDFDQQLYYMLDPLDLAQGDQVSIECTHDNTTDRTVQFGDSSLDEMCLVGLYRYPARDSPFICLE
jgi:hypothetical protein